MIQTINPFNGETLETYPESTETEIDVVLLKASEARKFWKDQKIWDKVKLISALEHQLSRKREALAKLMTLEMGKPIKQARAEIDKCGAMCRYYQHEAERFFEEDRRVLPGNKRGDVVLTSLGTILGVMPWNFPFWQVFRFAVPAILAGNSVVLKHASNVTGCALEIAKLFVDANAQAGLFSTLVLKSDKVEKLISDPRISGVSVTGSSAAGKKIAEVAGRNLKKCVLELGGSDAYLVLKDADVDLAVKECVAARMVNGGQSCVAGKRFIVHSDIFEKFREGFVANLKNLEPSNPLDEACTLGPLARKDLKDDLYAQVQKSLGQGAKSWIKKDAKLYQGALFPPEVLTDIPKDAPAYCEELFGPVASLISSSTEKEMIEIANSTPYGLGGAIFSKNTERAYDIAVKELDLGMCAINSQLASTPELPFGGVKESGYGRELSEFGVREFANVKSIITPLH